MMSFNNHKSWLFLVITVLFKGLCAVSSKHGVDRQLQQEVEEMDDNDFAIISSAPQESENYSYDDESGEEVVVLINADADGSANENEEGYGFACHSIQDIICSEDIFSKLCSFFSETIPGMGEVLLKGDTEWTLFAPMDSAFDDDDVQDFLKGLSEEDLTRLLKFHVHEGDTFFPWDLECQGKIMMVTGDNSRTKCMKDKDTGDDIKYQKGEGNHNIDPDQLPQIVYPSFRACNGIIHVIDQVMIPAYNTETTTETHDSLDFVEGKEDDDDDDDDDDHETKVIFIIRHGEKVWVPANETAYKYACESQQGWSRAYHMLSVFGYAPKEGLQTPEALYSFNYDNGDLDCRTGRGYYRTQATIAPLGEYLNITINNTTGSKPDLCNLTVTSPTCHVPLANESVHDFGMCCNAAAAEVMKSELFDESKNISAILASWEHANIAFLADALGANNCISPKTGEPIEGCNLEWSGDDFDKIFALYFDAKTEEFIKIDTNLYQEMVWMGPNNPGLEDYNMGPGEKPGIN